MHRRYGHLNFSSLKMLNQNNIVLGSPKLKEMECCDARVLGKHACKPFPSGKAWRATEKLQLIHADLCGPMQTNSLGGSKYVLLFIDDYTRMCCVFFI